MRVRPSPWLSDNIVDRATVARNPENNQLGQFTSLSPRGIAGLRPEDGAPVVFSFFALQDRQSRADQSHVRESLRKVPQCRSGLRVYFFAIQTQFVLIFQQSPEQLAASSNEPPPNARYSASQKLHIANVPSGFGR